MPDWARAPAPPEARPPRPLAPSAIAADDESCAAAERGDARGGAARDLIHQLLERLPAVDADAPRGSGADAGSSGRPASPTPPRATRSPTRSARSCPIRAFAPLFGPGSLGEAPLAATLPDGRVIAGTVDRLLVEDERVSVIDFKTGGCRRATPTSRIAPRADGGLCRGAARDLSRAATVSAALLYTAGPQLFELTP